MEGYVERHHVIPKCMGGTDDPENLVDLTPEEHYVAHLLLAKANPDESSLWYACHMMGITNTKPGRKNNKSYGFVRREFAKRISSTIRETWAKKRGFESYIDQVESTWEIFYNERIPTKEVAKRLGVPVNRVNACLNDYVAIYPEAADALNEVRFELKSKESKKTRANISPEAEARRIAATKSADYSERAKRHSIERRGSGNPNWGGGYKHKIVICPHCKKEGGKSVMDRWHFDNCKEKK